MMSLESRQLLCEDLVRQVATYGKRESADEMCAKIDALYLKFAHLATRMSCVAQDINMNIRSAQIVGRGLISTKHMKTCQNIAKHSKN